MAELSVDLVVATVDRTDELDRLLGSLERQTHPSVRILLVDQNDDDRVEEVVRRRPAVNVVRLTAPRGLARARNAALPELRADVVAFPDDDCVYGEGLLADVVGRFTARPELDGVLGRTVDADGRSSTNWAAAPQLVDRTNVWHCANSNSVFLRREVVGQVGAFDESLGLGSGTPWSSGEETEYLVRALDAGARIAYDPTLVVTHADTPSTAALGFRDGASVGYILGKHRYPATALARMLARPIGGAVVSLARLDPGRARFHGATLRGRLRGYRAGVRIARGAR